MTATTNSAALDALIGTGTIEEVDYEDLNVDEHYQRTLDHGLVNRIAQNWNAAAADPILVSKRADGTMWIVNGQHRAAGAKQAGHTKIMARVVEGLDRAGEAELRLRGNTRRGDTAQERFRAQVAAGHQQSIDILQVCADFETQINYTPNVHTGINSVSAVEALYEKDKGVTLVRVFEVIQDAWGTVGGKYVSVSSLKAIAWFLDVHRDAQRDRLVQRLQQVGIDELDRKARSHKAAQGGAMWVNYYRAMVEEYNHRLGEGARLMWRTTGAAKMLGTEGGMGGRTGTGDDRGGHGGSW